MEQAPHPCSRSVTSGGTSSRYVTSGGTSSLHPSSSMSEGEPERETGSSSTQDNGNGAVMKEINIVLQTLAKHVANTAKICEEEVTKVK